jgi:uridine kinase
MMERVADLVAVHARRARRRAPLIGLSGIDGSGKTTLAAALAAALGHRGTHAAVVTVDPWHAPASIRFNAADPARHFYRYAFRWEELFERLIDPLRRRRSLSLSLPLLRLADDSWYEHAYEFSDVDVVILEGIFVLRRLLRRRYDAAVWIDCSFETALRRALARNQEGLDEAALRRDYATIYAPAQRLHLRRDQPLAGADVVVNNDAQANASSSGLDAGRASTSSLGASTASLAARPQSTIL